MIGTELLKGQGLGNQLFAYVTARAIAKERGCEFGICHPECLANNIHSNTGMYFMDIDTGIEISEEDKKSFKVFDDDDTRMYVGTSKSDMENGAYISGSKKEIHEVEDNTLLYGNLQDESYFGAYKDEIKEWLKVKKEYDSKEYTSDNLCIIHMRCGDYENNPDLHLDRKYWINGMKNMRRKNPNMEFLMVTDDIAAAHKILPEVKAVCNDIGKDYVTIKNARYLLLANSSFAVFPAMTSDELKFAIAPKYWARHNVSNGYWASEQNIYSFLTYQDRKGKLFSADECRKELEEYKKKSKAYARRNIKPTGCRRGLQVVRRKFIYGVYFAKRIIRSLERRLHLVKVQ